VSVWRSGSKSLSSFLVKAASADAAVDLLFCGDYLADGVAAEFVCGFAGSGAAGCRFNQGNL